MARFRQWVIRPTSKPVLGVGGVSATRWFTLADTKTRLGISGSDQDTVLGMLLDRAASALGVLMGMRDGLALRGYELEGVGNGRDTQLLLPVYPVDPDAISSVTIRGDAMTVNDDYVVVGGGVLQRSSGWPAGSLYESDGTPVLKVVLSRAGYLMPGQISTWAVNTAYTAGQWVRPTSSSTVNTPLLFQCTAAGTSDAATEPTWLTATDTAITDNSVTWKGYRVEEIPEALADAAFLCVYEWQNERPDGLVEWRAGAFSERFSESLAASIVPKTARQIVSRFRQ